MGNDEHERPAWNDPPSDDNWGVGTYATDERYQAPSAEQGAIRNSAPVSVEDSQFPDDNWPGTETRAEEGEGRHEGVQVGDSVRGGTVQDRGSELSTWMDDRITRPSGVPSLRGEASDDGPVSRSASVGHVDGPALAPGDSITDDDMPLPEYPDPDTYYNDVEGPED